MSSYYTTANGGPAFPELNSQMVPGMSLRDWFAGQFLAGQRWSGGTLDELAHDSYQLADAMLAARVKP
jgi:hypothetical protein